MEEYSIFDNHMYNLLETMHKNNNFSGFDKEIIEEIKILALVDICEKKDDDLNDVFRTTINEVIRKNPALKNIIMDELTIQYFKHEHLNLSFIISYFGKTIGKKIMENSNSYDIILLFENGKQIKTHTQLLRSVGCFKFITDFPDDTSKQIRKEKVNFDYDNMVIIINYLYLGTGNINYKNCIEYILLIDSVDIQNNHKLFLDLCRGCIHNFNFNIFNCFNDNTFCNFLHKFDILLDILINNDSTITTNIQYLKMPNYFKSLFKHNEKKFDINILFESQFFTKRLLDTKYGQLLVEENKYFPLFKYIKNDDNYDRLFKNIITSNLPNMFDILLPFTENSFNFNNNRLIYKLPIETFDHSVIYNKMSTKNKLSLIVTHKQYDYLNTLSNLTKYDFEHLSTIMKDTNDTWNKLLLKQEMISFIIIYKQHIRIAQYNNFVIIKNIYPLSFSSYMYIGNVNATSNDDDFGICIDIAVYNSYLNTGQKIIISNNYDDNIQNYTFVIKKLYPYFRDNLDTCYNKFLLSKKSSKINIIFEKVNFKIPEILIDTNVFCETDNY